MRFVILLILCIVLMPIIYKVVLKLMNLFHNELNEDSISSNYEKTINSQKFLKQQISNEEASLKNRSKKLKNIKNKMKGNSHEWKEK